MFCFFFFCQDGSGLILTRNTVKSGSKSDTVLPWVRKVPGLGELDQKMPPLPQVQDPACFPGSLRVREVTRAFG